jgi:hypothetical protein
MPCYGVLSPVELVILVLGVYVKNGTLLNAEAKPVPA